MNAAVLAARTATWLVVLLFRVNEPLVPVPSRSRWLAWKVPVAPCVAPWVAPTFSSMRLAPVPDWSVPLSCILPSPSESLYPEASRMLALACTVALACTTMLSPAWKVTSPLVAHTRTPLLTVTLSLLSVGERSTAVAVMKVAKVLTA